MRLTQILSAKIRALRCFQAVSLRSAAAIGRHNSNQLWKNRGGDNKCCPHQTLNLTSIIAASSMLEPAVGWLEPRQQRQPVARYQVWSTRRLPKLHPRRGYGFRLQRSFLAQQTSY